MAVHVRDERPGDIPQLRAVHLSAFGSSSEADLVDALRRAAPFLISLVAEDGGQIVGHVLFSPVTLRDRDMALMGLAPMAVLPQRQRQGIGTRLVCEGLDRCRLAKVAAVVVLGHAEYYPPFGFAPANRYGLASEYDVPDEVFMVLELRQGALAGVSGTIRYHSVFKDF